MKEQSQKRDPEAERRLRKALRKTKALLHDTQEMLQIEVCFEVSGAVVLDTRVLTVLCCSKLRIPLVDVLVSDHLDLRWECDY